MFLKVKIQKIGESARNVDTINLFKYGYDNFNKVILKKKGEKISTVEIRDSKGDIKTLDVSLEEDISALNVDKSVAENIEPKIELDIDTIPIEEGEVIGTATFSINGEDYKANILAAETVSEDVSESSNKFNIINIIEVIIAGIFIILTFSMLSKIKLNSRKTRKSRYKKTTKAKKRGKHAL